MDESLQLELLERLLRNEVSSFCKRSHSRWKDPVEATIDEIRSRHLKAVFFGGTLRSLLISRIKSNQPGRPRDIDIVLDGTDIQNLRDIFGSYISRETRFGGLQLKRVSWRFDIWPLSETYAIKEDSVESPKFEDLPRTTFLNAEAIAVEVWPRPGHKRRVYSGDGQFFKGILSRTLEINRVRNPFPELCVVRSIIMANNLNWKIGPSLLRYIANHSASMTHLDFEDIQEKHYGFTVWRSFIFDRVITDIKRHLDRGLNTALQLKFPSQLTLWPEEKLHREQIRLRTLRFCPELPRSF